MPPEGLRPTRARRLDGVEHDLGGLRRGGDGGLAGRGLDEVGAGFDGEAARRFDQPGSCNSPVSRNHLEQAALVDHVAHGRDHLAALRDRRAGGPRRAGRDRSRWRRRQRLLRVVDDPLDILAAGGKVHHRRDPTGDLLSISPRPLHELRPDADGGDRGRADRAPWRTGVDGLLGAVVRQVGEVEAAQRARAGALGSGCQPWGDSATKERMRRLYGVEASAAVSLVSWCEGEAPSIPAARLVTTETAATFRP